MVVGDSGIILRGPDATPAKAAAADGLPSAAGLVPNSVQEWRPLRDSNPRCRRERAVSWASRRRGPQPRTAF